MSYWLDSNVYIQSYKGPYSFDVAPGFWGGLLRHASQGEIRSPMEVYDELTEKLEKKDQLALWARDHKEQIFVEADETVQSNYGKVGEHVRKNYEASFATKFMDDADSWLIAHAMSDGGNVVVTLEVPKGGLAVRIPNICNFFQIRWFNHYEMLRQLGIKLVEGGSS